MPTNDERREVAARLRHVAKHGAPEWGTTACCIAECIGEDSYPLWDGSEPLFSKLADLIEPEERTCRVTMKWDGLDGRDPVCSKCGAYFDDKKWHEQKFCPNCGAKVVQQ